MANKILLAEILKSICNDLGVLNPESVKTKSRDQLYVRIRQLYFYYCCNSNLFSLTKIGNEVNRDHSTVLFGRNKVHDLLSIYDKSILKDIEYTEQNVNRIIAPYKMNNSDGRANRVLDILEYLDHSRLSGNTIRRMKRILKNIA